MLDHGSLVTASATDSSLGGPIAALEAESCGSKGDPRSSLPSSPNSGFPQPHNSHADNQPPDFTLSGTLNCGAPDIFEKSDPTSSDATEGMLALFNKKMASLGQETAVLPLLNTGHVTGNARTPDNKVADDASSFGSSCNRSISARSAVDVSSDSYRSALSGNARSSSMGVCVVQSNNFGLSPEEALKMLSECESSAPNSSRSCPNEGHDSTSPKNVPELTHPDSDRSAAKEIENLDADLLDFLRSQNAQKAPTSRLPPHEEGNRPENKPVNRPSVSASVPSNHSESSSSRQSTANPLSHKFHDYSSYFREDSETLSKLRGLFVQPSFTEPREDDADAVYLDDPVVESDHDLEEAPSIIEWMPDEPRWSDDSADLGSNIVSLFTDFTNSFPTDGHGSSYIISDQLDSDDDVNAKVRHLRHVHESLYTSSDIASLGTIEKFMLELLQQDSNFGTLSPYGRLLAFINLSALRRHMSQLSALYRHPEMEVVRRVMRHNNAGAIRKALRISDAVSSGQMNDKAGTEAIHGLIEELDRKHPLVSDERFNDTTLHFDGETASAMPSSSGPTRSVGFNRRVIRMLDELASRYRAGGESHFPRYVCGVIDRKRVSFSETLSLPFDKGDRRNMHVQFELFTPMDSTPWPVITHLPTTLKEGLRLQVLPMRQQSQMYWTVGTVKSVSAGMLIVGVDTTDVKETGRLVLSDRMYMMRNFVPPNVPLTKLEKAHWRILPRPFDVESDIYIGSCISVFDPTVGGYVDRVVVNIIYDDNNRCCAPVKPPHEETLFEFQPPSSGLLKAEDSVKSQGLGIKSTSVSDKMVLTGIRDDTHCSVSVDTGSLSGDDIIKDDEGNLSPNDGLPYRDSVSSSAQSGFTFSTSSISEVDLLAVDSLDVSSPIIPTCHCNGYSLRVFEGRCSRDHTLRPKRVVLCSIYDRSDVTLDVSSIKGYKLNYDLQSHFDCGSSRYIGSSSTIFQHSVWVVPRTLSSTEVFIDPSARSTVGSRWFFEPKQCLMMFPFNRGIDILQDITRLIAFLHPDLNYMALCAGIWNIRVFGRTSGDVHPVPHYTSPGTDALSGRTEVISLTRSQKAATRELTTRDVVNESCAGVARCRISLINRLFGCTSTISLWMILDGLKVDSVDSSEPTLSIHIPEMPPCTTCGGAIYARDGVMKSVANMTLPSYREVTPLSSCVTIDFDNTVAATVDVDAISDTAADQLDDLNSESTVDNRSRNEGSSDKSTVPRHGLKEMRSIAHRSGSGIDFSELKSPSLVPSVGKVPISSARYTSVFSDLESTEGVIKLFQGLAKCRWRLIREFSASWNCDDDVSFSCPRSSHPPLTNAIPRNGGVKGGFINKLAQFLTSTRRARETTIDMDLYHDAYSSSREHFDPRSIEEVLLRGWCAFLVGKPSPSVPSPTAATQIPKSTPLPVTKGGTSPGKGEDWISCFDILGQHDLLAGKFMSHVSDDDLEAFAFAPGGHRRKGSEKRPRNSRGESPVGVRSANVDQRRVGVEPSRKPRRPSKTLIGRITDTEYCEFKDKQVRYKFVSVVKWDEDVESLSAITDKVLA